MLLLYFIFVHILLLVPAFGLFRRFRLASANPLLQLCLAYCASIAFLGASGIALYAFDVSQQVVRLIILTTVLIGMVYFLQQKAWEELLRLRFMLVLFAIMSLIPTIVINLSANQQKATFIPEPEYNTSSNYNVLETKVLNFAHTNANDNYIPYRQAQFFINNSDPNHDSFINEWGVSFFQRTVLMGSVVSSIFTMTGDTAPIPHPWSSDFHDTDHTYAKFQIIAHILNSILILPAFLLLSRLFNKKTAVLSSIFIASSHFYLYNSIFSWPKSLTAFFVLLSISLILDKRKNSVVLAGLTSGVAYLTHDLAIVYIATILLFLLLKSRWMDFVKFSLTAIPFPAIWAIIASVIYSKPSTFVYYPFTLDGLPNLDKNKGSDIIHNFFTTNPFEILKLKFNGLIYLASPYQLIFSEGGKDFGMRLWALGIYSVPGSLGLGLLGLGIYSLIAGFKKIPWEVWYFIFFPIFIILGLFGNPKVVGSLHFSEPIVVLLTGCIIFITLGLKHHGNKLVSGVLATNLLYVFFFIAYSFNFSIGIWLEHISDILSLLMLLVLYVTLFLCAVLVLHGSKSKYSKYCGLDDLMIFKS